MKKLFEKSVNIFSMYSRLLEFRNSENYQNYSNSHLDNEVIKSLYKIAKDRKKLFLNLSNTTSEILINDEDYFEKENIDYFLKKYEIKLLQFIHTNNVIEQNDIILILTLLKNEKKLLKKIVNCFINTDITVPYSWNFTLINNICIKNEKRISL